MRNTGNMGLKQAMSAIHEINPFQEEFKANFCF